MTNKKSMIDIAYDLMTTKKRAVTFQKLWEEVSKVGVFSNDLIAQFYSDLTLDPRFVSLKDNKWDLTERRKYAEAHIDMSEIELDEDEAEETEEDDGIITNAEDEY